MRFKMSNEEVIEYSGDLIECIGYDASLTDNEIDETIDEVTRSIRACYDLMDESSLSQEIQFLKLMFNKYGMCFENMIALGN